MATVLYPDLDEPPKGWTVGRQGSAIRLVPPGAYLDHTRAYMIVSPLVPRSRQLPPPAELILAALHAELARTGTELLEQSEARQVAATTGLNGSRLEVRLRRADGKIERRAYTMYQDTSWMYGLHYIADEETWPAFLDVYDRTAASVKPTPPS